MAATTPSKAVAVPPPDDDDGGSDARAPNRGTEKMQSGHDEEIAVIFREMRHALNLPADQLAGRLKTPTATLEALEAGNIPALPEWDETSRVVTAYTQILGLDSRPILRRLKLQGADGGAAEPESTAGPKPAPAAVPPAPPAPASEAAAAPAGEAARPQTAKQPPEGRARGKRKRFSVSALLSWLLLMLFFAVMAMGVAYLVANPKTVWTTVESLPEPVSRTIRSVWELVRPLDDSDSGTVIVDPNKRKSDKLPQVPRN